MDLEVFGQKVFAYESGDLHTLQHRQAGGEGIIHSSPGEDM
jgi:hypothetical protein